MCLWRDLAWGSPSDEEVPIVGAAVVGLTIVEHESVMRAPVPFDATGDSAVLHRRFESIDHAEWDVVVVFSSADVQLAADLPKPIMG